MTSMNEDITIASPLTVEHIMPQSWIDHWPLPDGSKGMSWEELMVSEPGDARGSEQAKACAGANDR